MACRRMLCLWRFLMAARIHLVNPSDVSFGVAVITPRWLYVLAAATGRAWGDPIRVDDRSRRRRRDRYSFGQCPARLRTWAARESERRVGHLRRDSCDALSAGT